jgi:hypothetical protein
VVGPVQPEPPHCAYLAAAATLATTDADADAEEALHTDLLVLAVLMMVVREEGVTDNDAAADAFTMVESDEGVEATAFTIEAEVEVETGVEVEIGVDIEMEEVFTVEEVLLDDTAEEATEATTAPTTLGILESSVLLLPVFAMISAGHATCSKSTVGLSEPPNQSNLQSQPSCSAEGKVEQSVAAEIPPYCAPHPLLGAPHSSVHPLKIPTPPPGIARSNWFDPRSPPVFVACTIKVFPSAAPEVNLRA